MLRRRPTLLVLLPIILATCYIFHLTPSNSPSLPPANSTLGFSTILAVSHALSPRRPTLLWAANLTGLSITIPPQTRHTNTTIDAFRGTPSSNVLTRGSALAWLGHLDALRFFLSTPHTTALILEDDTDFSLSLRTHQIPLLAAATRALLGTSPSTPHIHSDRDPDFWGPLADWDILYPGHCDDLPDAEKYLAHPHTLYKDKSAPERQLMHPDTANFADTLNVPPSTHLLHRALAPFCTFAYAVTRDSAARILNRHSAGESAYDVALLGACRDGWRCWSVVPEVFHHVEAGSEIARADGWDGGGEGPGRGTWNLWCGARGEGMWVGEEDEKGREEVMGLVGGMVERGECPVDGRERAWRGCEGRECGAQS